MKFNLNVVLKNLDGSPVTEAVVDRMEEGKQVVRKVVEVTMAGIATNALLSVPQEQDMPTQVKYNRYKLAQRIAGAEGEVELSAEEVSMLKDLIGKAYAPLVVGQAFDLLEGKAG